MTRRYFVPELTTMSGVIALPDEEAAHAVRVMRVLVGDSIELFDGDGMQATAEVTHAAKRQCLCRIESVEGVSREPSVELTLAIAIPKPDRAKEMIERLTEIGVQRIQPIVFERTQRPPTRNLIEKLERLVIESCKQSGRNHLMAISPPLKFAKWVTEYRASLEGRHHHIGYVAMPSTSPSTSPSGTVRAIQPLSSSQTNRPTASVVIGPEGGLAESELQDCLDAAMSSVDLGKRILRIETAACVFASRLLSD